jgi:aspartyl/asparaginyl beta-hydroxylase (cupin superfamily)
VAQLFWVRVRCFEVIAFHRHLFAVRASVQVLMASAPMASGETEKAVSTLEALASALVDWSEADLERLQATNRQVAPAGLRRPAWPRVDGSDKIRATS